MKVGYARVSTNEQDTHLQIDALKAIGCELIYQEKQSGAKKDRTELQQCLKSLREDDILIVWKLDRLGRSLQHLIEVVSDLEERKIGFQSAPTIKLITANQTHVFLNIIVTPKNCVIFQNKKLRELLSAKFFVFF